MSDNALLIWLLSQAAPIAWIILMAALLVICAKAPRSRP